MPTPHDAYPTKTEVDAFLATLPGITVPAGFDTDPNIRAAIGEWERLTEYSPFLSTGDVDTRRFDPPGPRTTQLVKGGSKILRFHAGLVFTSGGDAPVVTVGVEGGSAGTALTQDTDFWLWPSASEFNGKPYTAIEFACVQRGLPRSITVEAVWGYSLTIPDEAWKAVRDLAAAGALQDIRESIKGSPVEVKDDEVTLRSSIEMLQSVGEDLAVRASKVALAFRLIS